MEDNLTPPQIQQETKKNQFRKLKLVFGVLILIAITTFGVYLWQQQKITSLQKEIVSLTQQLESKKSEKVTTQETKTNDNYLEIPELGVKIKLSEDIKDAYYQVENVNAVSLKTHSSDSEVQCRDNSLSIVGLFKQNKTAIDPLTDEKYSDNRDGATVGENFYYVQGAQYQCAESQLGAETVSSARKAFVDASKSIEMLEE